MSLTNIASDNSDSSASSASGLDDFGVEPGFLVQDQTPGLESFGSEDDGDSVAAGRASSWTSSDSDFNARVGHAIFELTSNTAPCSAEAGHPEPPKLPELIRKPRHSALVAKPSQLISGGASLARRAAIAIRNLLVPPLRWSLTSTRVRVVLVILVTIVGIAEAGWIGVRAAKGVRELLAGNGLNAAAANAPLEQPQAGPESPLHVSVRSDPPSVPPENQRVPGWVAITAPIPVQILERGRVLGASWNGGVRLSPGHHKVRIVNRTSGIDIEQSLDVAPGSATSVLLEYLSGSVQINAIPQASVQIDGKAVGKTPVVDLQLVQGAHEVLFSHPRFGERRMTINVLAGKPLKLTTDLRR